MSIDKYVHILTTGAGSARHCHSKEGEKGYTFSDRKTEGEGETVPYVFIMSIFIAMAMVTGYGLWTTEHRTPLQAMPCCLAIIFDER